MNKNPFATAAYTPQQPPLPPGPPPPQPAQPDYTAYWAAAAAAQQAQQPAAAAAAAYTAQWNASQTAQQAATAVAAARPPDQAHLYANYGYGVNWQAQQRQQQQQQQQQAYQPPPPVVQPPPPPTQPQYSPYQPQYNPSQPQAGAYQQPYVPQATPQAIPQAIPQAPYQQAPAQPFQQPQQFFPQQPQQQHRQNRPPNTHHASPQQFPPAKRQRFDGPNQHRGGPPPPQPQFQPPPPPPMQQQGGMYNQNQGPGPYGRGGAPGMNQSRGGYNGGRGGSNLNPRGRGGSMNMTRGGNRGRGGGSYNNLGGRGGTPQTGSFRGHNSNRGFNRDNRRGGSFVNQGYSHGQHQQPQQSYGLYQSHSSSRGRGQSYHYNNRSGGRHDGGASISGRDSVGAASASFSSGKKDENKRTLTDFKIIGLKIPELDWSWGVFPDSAVPIVKEEPVAVSIPSEALVATEPSESTTPAPAEAAVAAVAAAAAPVLEAAGVKDIAALLGPPPSRVRIYFHTPVSPDDAHPISSHSSGYNSNARKGKRKKLEDEDGDYEEGRGAPPPPPHGSGMGRDSLAPSGDWLMAAIGEEEVEQYLGNGDAGDFGNEYDQGDGHDGDHVMGDEDAQGSEVGPDDETYSSFNANGPNGHAVHPQANGNDHVDASSGSQEQHESGSIPAVQQGNANQSSQDTIASTPPLNPPAEGGAAPPADAPASVAPAEAQKQDSNVDASHSANAQASPAPAPRTMPLQAMDSIASTVPDTNQDPGQTTPYASTVIDGGGDEAEQNDHEYEPTQPTYEPEHSYEPPSVAHDLDAADDNAAAPALLGDKIPSANRLSVSYAGATKRLVVDAEVVPKLKVFRAEGRVEVTLMLQEDERGGLKGIAMEGCSEANTYVSLDISEQLESEDPTVPPFSKAKVPSQVSLILYLDKEKPLSEPRWVKTGDVQEWLRSMFGRMFWVAGDAADGWERRIDVADPDPAPTIWTVLDSWANNLNVGQQAERQRFLRTHMTETDNILEVLLRLVRGERSTFTQNAPLAPPSVSGPLLSALAQGSAHGAQQTHVSLAVLAMFRLAVEYATRAAGDRGKAEVDERVGEIIRSLPSHLVYKSLDGIFKEWRVEKKGGSVGPPSRRGEQDAGLTMWTVG
ncbi:hypothetical protein BC628DRAFT_1408843 [Trametes gibbosa]|nr:hypothetical protein BC628DRAFT_1408843 [Trametes gibbosa]